MNNSLEVYNSDGIIVFERDGKWLHPLFALMDYLSEPENEMDITNCTLHDKIIGAAAAVLIIKMGFRKCHGLLMSEKAAALFKQHEIEYNYDKMVEGILCKTEKMIEPNDSINTAVERLIELRKENRQKMNKNSQ